MKSELALIGFELEGEDWRAVGAKKTREQIEYVKSFECNLYHKKELDWEQFDDPSESNTLFQAIEKDRAIRIDKKTFMANRPLFAVITIIDGKAARLEFYEGHDALELACDIRSKELADKELEPFMAKDGLAYNPVEFLHSVLGIPQGFSMPILDESHKKDKK